MRTSESGMPPAGGDVHVWHGVMAGEPADEKGTAADLAVLSRAERARSQRLVRPGDRARFVAAHAGARRVLGHYLAADPAAIRLGRVPCCKCGSTKHGRPRIEWPVTALQHNLSRSGRHWLLAVTVGRPVGVDIECHRSLDIARMAQECLSEDERAYMASQPPAARPAVFFRCWTRKEAVLKACGVGIVSTLSRLEARPQRDGAVAVRHISGTCPDTWLVQDLPGGAQWSAAVAQPAGQDGPVLVHEYAPPAQEPRARGRSPAGRISEHPRS